jgi:hypothetical protein
MGPRGTLFERILLAVVMGVRFCFVGRRMLFVGFEKRTAK